MATETLEAWFMGQPFSDQMEIVLHRLALGGSEVYLASLSAFFTTNLNVHDAPQPLRWIIALREGKPQYLVEPSVHLSKW
jgi:hypothetical protein